MFKFTLGYQKHVNLLANSERFLSTSATIITKKNNNLNLYTNKYFKDHNQKIAHRNKRYKNV